MYKNMEKIKLKSRNITYKCLKTNVFLLISTFSFSLFSCLQTNENNISLNINKYIKEEGIVVPQINLRINDTTYFYAKESYENNLIPIFKYQLKDDSSKFLYSYNDNNSYSFDFETNSYNVYGSVEGIFDTYKCYYLGEIGYLSSSCSLKLYEESNFLEIKIDNKKNCSLSSADYKSLVESEKSKRVQDKDDLIETLNSQTNRLSSFETYSIYLDLNFYDNLEYIDKATNENISKQIVKKSRNGKYSSSYVACFGDYGTTYILGGKNNVFEVNKFSNGKEEKYLPISSSTTNVTINNENYQNSYEVLGEVLLEVSPSIDYDSDICNHFELNYRNYNMSEEDFSKFMNQNVIEYSINDEKYSINTKKAVSYSENIKEYGSYIFINVE